MQGPLSFFNWHLSNGFDSEDLAHFDSQSSNFSKLFSLPRHPP